MSPSRFKFAIARGRTQIQAFELTRASIFASPLALGLATAFALALAFPSQTTAADHLNKNGNAAIRASGGSPRNPCTFVARKMVSRFMGGMPKEVTGWATCYDRAPEISAFIVARFKRLGDQDLKAFLLRYADAAVYSTVGSSVVLRQSHGPNGMQQIIARTARARGNESIDHYGFTAKAADGSVVLFIHSHGEAENDGLKPILKELRTELVRTADNMRD